MTGSFTQNSNTTAKRLIMVFLQLTLNQKELTVTQQCHNNILNWQ